MRGNLSGQQVAGREQVFAEVPAPRNQRPLTRGQLPREYSQRAAIVVRQWSLRSQGQAARSLRAGTIGRERHVRFLAESQSGVRDPFETVGGGAGIQFGAGEARQKIAVWHGMSSCRYGPSVALEGLSGIDGDRPALIAGQDGDGHLDQIRQALHRQRRVVELSSRINTATPRVRNHGAHI